MSKSSQRPHMGKALETQYSYGPVPKIDEKEFKRQIREKMTMHPDYIDDRLPEDYLHRCLEGECCY